MRPLRRLARTLGLYGVPVGICLAAWPVRPQFAEQYQLQSFRGMRIGRALNDDVEERWVGG